MVNDCGRLVSDESNRGEKKKRDRFTSEFQSLFHSLSYTMRELKGSRKGKAMNVIQEGRGGYGLL